MLFMASASCTSFKSYSPGSVDGVPKLMAEKATKALGVPYFLPRGVLLVRAEYQKPEKEGAKQKYMITVVQQTRADPTEPQFLHIKENVFYDEKSQIKVQNGLLTSVNAEPNDRTADVIRTVVGMALDLAKMGNMTGGAKRAATATAQTSSTAYGSFDVEIDPFNEQSCQNASEKMAEAGWHFELSAFGTPAGDNTALKGACMKKITKPIDNADSEKGDEAPGPVYRVPTPVVIQLKPLEGFALPENAINGGEGHPNRPEFIMPVPGSYAYVPVRRGFLSKRTTNVAFSQGMPTDVLLEQPSPALEAVKLPASIVKMVGEALPALVKVENKAAPPSALDQIKAENAMLEQQVRQLEFERRIRELGGTP